MRLFPRLQSFFVWTDKINCRVLVELEAGRGCGGSTAAKSGSMKGRWSWRGGAPSPPCRRRKSDTSMINKYSSIIQISVDQVDEVYSFVSSLGIFYPEILWSIFLTKTVEGRVSWGHLSLQESQVTARSESGVFEGVKILARKLRCHLVWLLAIRKGIPNGAHRSVSGFYFLLTNVGDSALNKFGTCREVTTIRMLLFSVDNGAMNAPQC